MKKILIVIATALAAANFAVAQQQAKNLIEDNKESVQTSSVVHTNKPNINQQYANEESLSGLVQAAVQANETANNSKPVTRGESFSLAEPSNLEPESTTQQSRPKKFRRISNFFGFYGENIKTSDSQFSRFFGTGDELKLAYGFASSINVRLTEKFGILIDTSSNYTRRRNQVLRAGSFDATNAVRANISQRRYDILAGPQFTFADRSRVQPFVYGLAGAELNLQKADAGAAFGKREDLYANFAVAVGGGFDISINRSISIRPLQIDYKPVFQRERTDFLDTGKRIEDRRLDQTRIAFGIVLNL